MEADQLITGDTSRPTAPLRILLAMGDAQNTRCLGHLLLDAAEIQMDFGPASK